jgi:hypothetical protein
MREVSVGHNKEDFLELIFDLRKANINEYEKLPSLGFYTIPLYKNHLIPFFNRRNIKDKGFKVLTFKHYLTISNENRVKILKGKYLNPPYSFVVETIGAFLEKKKIYAGNSPKDNEIRDFYILASTPLGRLVLIFSKKLTLKELAEYCKYNNYNSAVLMMTEIPSFSFPIKVEMKNQNKSKFSGLEFKFKNHNE